MAYKQKSPIPITEGGTGDQSFTSYAVVCGGTATTNPLQSIAGVGTLGQVLMSNGAAALPTFQTLGGSSIVITGDTGGALTSGSFTFTGGTTGLTFAGAGSTETLGGTLAIANGGTNATSMTNTDGVVYYDGTRLVTTAVGTATQVLTSNGAGVAPSFQSAGGGGFTWSVITANQTAAVNNGYFCNKAGTLALALPAVSVAGDVIEVANINTATGIQFTQAANQQIFFAGSSTTLGATGTLTSSAVGDTMKIVCRTANLVWQTISVIGNWTVV